MARTYEANVILGLKDQLSKGAPKAAAAVDALGKSLDRAEKEARQFAAAASKMPAWGGAFQKQIDRLRLSVAETERLKASWVALNKEIGVSGNKAFQTVAQTRWRNEALAGILAIREAQRQLSADAIKETRAQVAAEKKLLAEAAREKARLAREAARVGQQAVREAARAAVQAARDAARAERTAQQETVKAARDAAREKERLAREAARVAKEEARAAAAEAKRLDREAARARREALREEAGHRRRLVGWGSDTVRNLGYAAGLGGGAYMAGRGIRATAISAAELEREKARDYLAGLSPQDTARLQARAFSSSAAVRSVDAASMHNLLRETALTNIGMDGAMKLAPSLASGMAVLGSMKSPQEALSALTRLLRGLDTLGKNVDVDVIQRLLDGFVRAQGVEGAEFSVGDVYTAAKRSKSGGFALNERFLTRILPALIADLGPDQVGTALGSSVSQVIGGRATKASMAEQRRYGLRDKRGIFKQQDLFLTDPFEYTTKVLVPALKAMGVDPNDDVAVTAAMSKLFSNQRVADLFGRMVLQAEQYIGKERKMDQAPGLAAGQEISERDPFVAAAGAVDQLKNAVAALLEPLNPVAIGAMNGFADAMARIAAWAKGEGGMTLGDVAIGGGTAAAGAYGAYKIYSLLSGGFGLSASAAALDASAAALTAAAGKLGAAGAVPDMPGKGTAVSAAAVGAGGLVAGGAAALAALGGATIVAIDADAKKNANSGLPDASQLTLGAMDPQGALAAAVFGPNGRQAAQQAGKGIGSDVVAGLKGSEPQVQAASQSIFDRIKAIFGVGIDVPIRPTMSYPGVGTNRAGARGPGSIGIDSAGRATGPGRSSGGHVVAGGLYIVNELGQEGFVPDESGTVIPHDQLNRAGSNGAARAPAAARGPVTIGPFHFQISGAQDPRMTAEEITRELRGVFADYGLDFA